MISASGLIATFLRAAPGDQASGEYIKLGDARIDNNETLVGEYDENYALVFVINLNFVF